MKTNTMRTFALIGTILMIFSLVPITAFAANNGNGNNGIATMDADRTRLQDHKDPNMTPNLIQEKKLDREQIKVQLSKSGYAELRGNFQNAKALQAKGELNATEAMDAAKEYLTGTVDYMIERLETIKEEGDHPEEVNERIDGYIDRLEAQKDDIAAADTRKDLSEATRDVRKIWNDAQKDLKKARAQNINGGLANYLEKADSISERLQNEIDRLNEEGEDTEELQEMLDEYNKLIEEAKQTHERAREAYQNGDEDAGDQLREAIKLTNEANDKLRKITQEMKEFRHGFVTLAGEGVIDAEGNGTIVLSGELKVEFTATNAMIVIKDLAGDAEIELDGDYDLVNEENADKGKRALVYQNFNGEAKIEGSRLTVMLRGEDIVIKAEGTGSSSLSGEGSYKIVKDDESTELEWGPAKVRSDDDDEEDDEDDKDSPEEDDADEEDDFDDNSTEEMDDEEDDTSDDDSDDSTDDDEDDSDDDSDDEEDDEEV